MGCNGLFGLDVFSANFIFKSRESDFLVALKFYAKITVNALTWFQKPHPVKTEVAYRQPLLQEDWRDILIEFESFQWSTTKLLSVIGRFLPETNFVAASTIQTTNFA
jgi:hypothetical protein